MKIEDKEILDIIKKLGLEHELIQLVDKESEWSYCHSCESIIQHEWVHVPGRYNDLPENCYPDENYYYCTECNQELS